MTFHFNPRLGLLIFLLLLSGCSDGRVAIRGKVSINGTPVKEGSINFRPIDVTSPGSAVAIIDGKYSIPAGNGVFPGEYLVQIFASEDTGKFDTSVPGPPVRIYRDLIPPKFNAKSELKAKIARGKSCDFDLVVDEKDFEGGLRKFSESR